MNNLVSAKWLKDNIDDENIVIIDCRFNLMDKEYGKKAYEKGHIKGAKRVDIETQLSSVVKEHGGRHPLPSIEELKNTFENIGISNDSIVISYDEGDLSGASRLWWILKYLGHDKVYVLDGGLEVFKDGNFTGDKNLFHVVIFLLIIGFSTKAGMFPMHGWLPTAHPVAPSPASAVLSLYSSGISPDSSQPLINSAYSS